MIQAYAQAYPGRSIADLTTYDIFFRKPVIDFVKKRKTYKQSNIYAYVFAVEFPLDDGKPAWHCSDLAFVFHNTDKVPVANMPGVTDKLEEKMCKAWVNFAKTGIPFIDETIAWPACTEETENYMVIENDKWQVREKFDYELVKQVADSGMKSPFSVKERRKMLQKTQKEAEEKGVFLH